MTSEWKEWSSWLREGYYISYAEDGLRAYEHILYRDWAHWELVWEDRIPPGGNMEMEIPDEMEITRGYDGKSGRNNIWQMIFGIKSQVYIYIELPTDTYRHGLPKKPKPDAHFREVAHFEEYMSPFKEPSFITEHFLKRPNLSRIAFDAYNPENIYLQPRLNIMVAKLVTERLGQEEYDENGNLVLTPFRSAYKDTLDKLNKRSIPHRPLTLLPIRMPAEAPTGE